MEIYSIKLKPKIMETNYLLSILSEDKKGLVSIVANMLTRKGIEIESFSAARTDDHANILLTIEVVTNATEIRTMLLKIKNIVEVYHAEACLLKDAFYHKVATYILDKQAYNSELHNNIQKYGAVMVGYEKDKIIIQKTGRDEHIQALYNVLDGKYLKCFSRSAAIAIRSFNNGDEEVVISRAA